MIPVTPQPEPEDFDTKVRQKGLRWLAEHDIDITDPLPSRTKLPPYWRACLDELHRVGMAVFVPILQFSLKGLPEGLLSIFAPSLCALILRMNGAITVWPVPQ